MLNLKERVLMRVIFSEGEKKGLCLLSPTDILTKIPLKHDFKKSELGSTLKAVEIADYIEVTESYKKDELIYCITLKQKGLGFKREERELKIKIIKRIAITIGVAILSFAVKLILEAIFK